METTTGTIRQKTHFILFNDLMIHIPTDKMKKKSNLLKNIYHWPPSLLWVEREKREREKREREKREGGEKREREREKREDDCFVLVGPTERYWVWCGEKEKEVWIDKIRESIFGVFFLFFYFFFNFFIFIFYLFFFCFCFFYFCFFFF